MSPDTQTRPGWTGRWDMWLATLSGIALGFMMLFVFAGAILRYAFNAPIVGGNEVDLVQYQPAFAPCQLITELRQLGTHCGVVGQIGADPVAVRPHGAAHTERRTRHRAVARSGSSPRTVVRHISRRRPW